MRLPLILTALVATYLAGCETTPDTGTAVKKEFCTQGVINTIEQMHKHESEVSKLAKAYAVDTNLNLLSIDILPTAKTRSTSNEIQFCNTAHYSRK